ncbi:Uncharacterised protein [Mycobacteroides abscessus subsp. abscessus]|nr:Uncharacterised protein [Mycobacteroides abscessus subsp. abscessus]
MRGREDCMCEDEVCELEQVRRAVWCVETV